MRRKKIRVIILTALLFLSVVVLGISSVYRVNGVTVEASLVSEEAFSEAEALKIRLEEAYNKKNIFSVNESEAQEIIEDFPYFRITGFYKTYPDRLVFEIVEDVELYAVDMGNGTYYMLDENGVVLDVREDYRNRLNGEANILLKGLTLTMENGSLPTGDDCFVSVMEICNEMTSLLEGIRSNVVSVEVFSRSPEEIYVITMREGVKIYLGNVKEQTIEKTQRAISEYLALANDQKLTGRIVVSDADGEIYATYASKDEFAK